ncbi:MAG: leuA [Fibrobacteres bacterium]|nr:leuA [Fibrobacterota bacterium]
MNTTAIPKQPFFYDVTLRDGNQALRHPWDLQEKEQVFRQLLKLGVQGIEVGFSGASEMDFAACEHLAKLAPDNVVISGLARCVERDITMVWEAIQHAKQPRIHTFLATSPFAMENVLRMTPQQVKDRAVKAIATCRKVMGGRGTIQFSAEHFGDSRENLDFVIDVFHAVIAEGAHVINLPNTVERYRPKLFVEMVEKVVAALPPHITIAVHTHNDLGMATATTVESYFAGATQLECALNGLGERAGNTNMYEVALALANCEVDVPLNLGEIYETALRVSEWARVPIYEKAPLVGTDVISHRSGIHQDGASKTKGMKKGAYRAIDSSLIGRKEGDKLGFTSQSGKTAVFELVRGLGLPISIEEAAVIQPILKKLSEQDGRGELNDAEILKVYDQEILNVRGPLAFKGLRMEPNEKEFYFDVEYQGKDQALVGRGTGPIDACMHALETVGLFFHLIEYSQMALDVEHMDFAAYALSEIKLQRKDTAVAQPKGAIALGRGKDMDTIKANVRALFNAVNQLLR